MCLSQIPHQSITKLIRFANQFLLNRMDIGAGGSGGGDGDGNWLCVLLLNYKIIKSYEIRIAPIASTDDDVATWAIISQVDLSNHLTSSNVAVSLWLRTAAPHKMLRVVYRWTWSFWSSFCSKANSYVEKL